MTVRLMAGVSSMRVKLDFLSYTEAEFVNILLRFLGIILSSQTSGFCLDFLNHTEGDMVSYQVFLLSPLQCTVTEL
jgi:hypothetical protein